MDIMQESITTHIYTIYIFLVIILFNLYSVLTVKEFFLLAKRYKFMTPIYHLCNAVIAYTGAIIAAYRHSFDISIAIMIIASIALMILEIKRYKKQRVIKLNDTNLQAKFYIYAKNIYTIELMIVVLVYIISKIL